MSMRDPCTVISHLNEPLTPLNLTVVHHEVKGYKLFYINFIIQKKRQTGPGSAAIDKLYRQIDNEPHSSLNLPFHHKVKGYKLFHKNFIIQTRPSIHSSEITDKKRRDTDRQMDNEPLSTSSYTTKSRYTNFIIKKQGKLPIAAK